MPIAVPENNKIVKFALTALNEIRFFKMIVRKNGKSAPISPRNAAIMPEGREIERTKIPIVLNISIEIVIFSFGILRLSILLYFFIIQSAGKL